MATFIFLGKKSKKLEKIASADKNIDNSANFLDIVKKKFWLATDGPFKQYKDWNCKIFAYP